MQSPSRAQNRPTWHRVYYALGAFNVISVLAAIGLSYKAMSGFAGSIEINEQWANRLGRYSELAQAASRADAPGNDVFENNQVEREAARLHQERDAFDHQYDEAVRDLRQTTPPAVHGPLLAQLAQARRAFDHMMVEGDEIFVAFRRGDRDRAGHHMALMDRQYSDTGEALNALLGAVRGIQEAEFTRQQEESGALHSIEYVLAAFVVLIVTAVVAYGRKLALVFARQQAMIDSKNRDMRRVLDHVAQGFLTIQLDGTLSAQRSQIADRWFGAPAEGATLIDHLAPRCPEFARSLALGLGELRDDVMPPDLVLHQLPRRMQVADRIYDVAYTPIAVAGSDGAALTTARAIDQLLVVISDVTDAVAREITDGEQREMVGIFQRISVDRSGVEEFLLEAGALVTDLRDERDPVVQKRLVHTLKGNCAIYGMASYAALTQSVESELAETGGGLSDDQRTMLVDMWRQAMRRVAGLLGSARRETVEVERSELAAAAGMAGSAELAAVLESWTREPVARRLDRLAMHITEVARRLGKPEPKLELRGNGIRLDTEGWTAFWAAMVHVARNAVDHGIEDEKARVAAGKPRMGQIALEVVREDGDLLIRVIDDGRGIDWDRVRQRAEALGLPCANERELVAALFQDGLSTREQATETSGRGVGLSALAEVVHDLGGTIEVRSEPGRGTAMTFRFSDHVRAALVGARRLRSSLVPQFD